MKDKSTVDTHPIIFLDIDGVLNSTSYSIRLRNMKLLRLIDSTHCKNACHEYVDIIPVKMIFNLCCKHDARIVLSSSWRKSDFNTTIELLNEYCDMRLLIPFIIDQTPLLTRKHMSSRVCRGDEIQEWLDNHQDVKRYVIIDDDSDMLESQKTHFIQTDHKFGFTFYEYTIADQILKMEVA